MDKFEEVIYEFRKICETMQRTLRYQNELLEAILITQRNNTQTILANEIARRYK